MKKILISLFLISVIIFIYIIGRTTSDGNDKNREGSLHVRVQLQWFDGAQFTGFYVAQEKGYYEEEGLSNIDLIPIPGYTASPIELLKEGHVDIAIGTADQVLINATRDNSVKAIGTVFNRSLARYMYKKEKFNKMHIGKLKGEKIAVYSKFDTENILKSLAFKHDLNLSYDTDILQAGRIEAFINDEAAFWGSYVHNEPEDMKILDIDVGLLDPEEHGVEFYSDTLIVTNKYLNDHRNIVKKFLRASQKGWEYAKENPEDAINIMFKNIKNKTKDEHYKKELASLKILLRYLGAGPDNKIFYMNRDRWLKMEEDLLNVDVIPQKGYIDRLCDFKILNEK